MTGKFITSLNEIFCRFQNVIALAVLRRIQPGFCVTELQPTENKSTFSIKDLWGDGFYWAVPKHRRSLEKRLNRKFGYPEYNWKPLVPKTNLLMCRACGHYHEAETICGHCYQKIMDETKEMQKVIDDTLKLDPVKDDIVVFYQGENNPELKEFWKGQRIVEMPKKRPAWFHNNLLQSTTQELSDSKEVKTKDLA